MLPVARLAFGVRYEPHYGIRDRLGTIVDAILYSPSSPFNAGVFPFSQAEAHRHRLIRADPDDSLSINEREVVLSVGIVGGGVERIRETGRDFDRVVMAVLHKEAELTGIVRYGMLLQFAEASASLREPLAKRYLGADFDDVASMSLRFVRRLPTEEGYAKKDVNDYRNVIYSLAQADDGKSEIGLDYQEYFDPALTGEDCAKRTFLGFVVGGLTYLEDRASHWLNSLLAKEQVA